MDPDDGQVVQGLGHGGLWIEECRDCLGTGQDPVLTYAEMDRNYAYCLSCWGVGEKEVQRVERP